jgi:hypothetical protein
VIGKSDGTAWDESTKSFAILIEGAGGEATVDLEMVWDETAKSFGILIEDPGRRGHRE